MNQITQIFGGRWEPDFNTPCLDYFVLDYLGFIGFVTDSFQPFEFLWLVEKIWKSLQCSFLFSNKRLYHDLTRTSYARYLSVWLNEVIQKVFSLWKLQFLYNFLWTEETSISKFQLISVFKRNIWTFKKYLVN